MYRYFLIRDRQIHKMNEVAVKPLTVRPGRRIEVLTLVIRDDPLSACIHEKHLTRSQP